MKGSMKKLAVFVVVGAIATFIAAAIASAGDKHWKTLHGEYASTGTSTCLTSDLGFTTILTPLPNSKVFLNSHSALGVMTFNRDGTGTLQTKAVFMVPPPAPGAPGPSVPIAGSFISSLQFTYNITDDGTITTELVPGTFLATYLTGPIPTGTTFWLDQWSLSGMISADHKTLTLGSGGTAVEESYNSLGGHFHQICYRSIVLIRLDE